MNAYQNSKIGEVRLNDAYFAPRIAANHTNTLPANVRKCHETTRLEAFRLDWKKGMPNHPHFFWDSDVAKVLEGMAYDLILNPDPEREKELNEYVDLVCSAQQPDGYLNIFFTVALPEMRWKNLHEYHELYCAGHLMEAAVAHWQATGKRNFLDCMCRYADYIASVFGREPGQLRGYPGHEEIELALCKLADATGNKKYLDLAKYFVDERGTEPNYFAEEIKQLKRQAWPLDYYQAHKPVREQTEAVGHAVRALYLYSGMADVALRTDDKSLLDACERLWNSVTKSKMFVTGGIGSNPHDESFSYPYNLPNTTAYAESCAAMALVLFSERMLNLTGDSKYADVRELGLCNGAISGISLSGTEFFYANPIVIADNCPPSSGHNMTRTRQPWFGCSCCPTSFCRFIPQIASFAYSKSGDALRIAIPVAANGAVALDNGEFKFEVTGGYPFDGHIVFRVLSAPETPVALEFRIPGWCRKYTASMQGELKKGFLVLKRTWKPGDEVVLDFDMPVELVRANPLVEEDAGKVALSRGPVVYCLESVDNGKLLSQLLIPGDQTFRLEPLKGLLDVPGITGKAIRETLPETDTLYSAARPERTETEFHAIPYALWQNRGDVSMTLWLRTV